MITLVDYGAGNLHSLEGALARLGLRSLRAASPEQAAPQGALLLPGVGHFSAARAELVARGWWQQLPRLAAQGRPLLGICLGLQLLAEGSEESPGLAGLGLLPGVARLLGPGVKVPHMGWARVRGGDSHAAGPAGGSHPAVPAGDGWLYFVHSYALDCTEHTVLAAEHGRPFAAVQARGAVLGFQGHPEKSGGFGQGLLGAALGWMGELPCA